MFEKVQREELTADAMKLFNQHEKRLDAKSDFKRDAGPTVPPFCFLCMF